MSPLARDLDHIVSHTAAVWDSLRDARLFVTGGTGFFGCWLLESFAWAWERRGLDASMTVLTRSAERFRVKAPHLARHPAIRLVEGDVRDFHVAEARFTHVIHAAFDGTPENCGESIVAGTRRMLELAAASGAKRFLLTSSGAVYGVQPAELSHIPETWPGGDVQPGLKGVYAEAKRSAERLCAES